MIPGVRCRGSGPLVVVPAAIASVVTALASAAIPWWSGLEWTPRHHANRVQKAIAPTIAFEESRKSIEFVVDPESV